MIELTIATNSLTLVGQCHTREQIEACITELVGCIVLLQPKLNTRTAALFVDIDTRAHSLGMEEPLVASLSHMRDRQVVRQFYLYAKNHPLSQGSTNVEVKIESDAAERWVNLPHQIVEQSTHWISFSNVPGFKCGPIKIYKEVNSPPSIVQNAERNETVRQWLPKFEPSAKHKLHEYQTAKGIASRMDLTENVAQEVLSHSIKYTDDVRYGLHRGTFYEFKLTRIANGQAVFHGYAIDAKDVPDELRKVNLNTR